MAEMVVTELVKVILLKMADEAMNQIVRAQGIHSELKKLGKKMSQIQGVLNDAAEQETTRNDVKQWLNSLQHLAYDIDDVLDDLATEAMHRELTQESGAITSKVRKFIPNCCRNFLLSNRLRERLDDIAMNLQELEKEKHDLGLIEKKEKPKNSSREKETSLPDASRIVGLNGEKEILLGKLLRDESCKENFSIVPIVGMGGVGKTTLARLLYNETQVNDQFELRAWVCVSDDFDIFKISKTIFQDLTKEDKGFADLNQLQLALIEQVKGKSFLLVIDDIWCENYDDWENLVKPFQFGAPGSKIIMTTRKEGLLEQLGFDKLDHLKSLSDEDALSLFALHALGVDNFNSKPTFKRLGEGIVKKCGCLPLALRALGRLLRMKSNEQDWEDVLNSEIWLSNNDDKIIPALKLSYQELSACSKRLFAYCSLFPKNFVFDKDELVLLWMAEGLLKQSTRSNLTEERLGHTFFEELLSRSFFQRAPNEESLFVMHDLMNDLATYAAQDFFLRLGNQMEIEKEALEKYRHMSFIREEYVGYKKFGTFKRDSLRTLLAVSVGVKQSWDRFYLSNKILVDLLPELPLLRVLSLSGFEISKVPEFIGSLKHLRYLNLSQTQIEELPETVGNLYNLQTLIVFGCYNLTKLPNSFIKLKNLRHFDFRDTPLLKIMPFGIGELKNLQNLTKIIIGEDNRFSITKLKDLTNIHGKVSINGLEKLQNATQAREAKLSVKRLTELELEWSDVFDGSRNVTLEKEVLHALKPLNVQLKKLGIMSYGGIEFPSWVGDPSFLQLTCVSIHGCRNCASLPSLGQLPSLKELHIEDLKEVKSIGSELLGSASVAFSSLEILSFKGVRGWEVWSTNSSEVNEVFPCLQELRLEDCPNLVEVSLEALPSLRVLYIHRCGEGALRGLVRAASLITKLEIKSISWLTDEVWRSTTRYLAAVEEIKIEECNEIVYVWESIAEASNVLLNLRKLVIWNCSNLVSLGKKEEGDNYGSNLLTSFRNLEIWLCPRMERCICPNNIETLSLDDCLLITSVTFPPTGGRQKLKVLTIIKCDSLLENGLGEEKIDNTSMPVLKYVKIVGWSNLTSNFELSYSIYLTHLMIEKCPSFESFPNLELPNLTHLIIFECPSMKSFPDLQLPNLTFLKHMRIRNCPSLDASFPRGHWPPKLYSLEIGGLKKPISDWGPQNFPTSFAELELYGEHVSDFSCLSDLLPSTLTTLEIKEFEKLESLSMGLQHLTSLQHLIIRKCPNLTELPQMLFPSLLRLRIEDCPNLTERTSKRSSYYWRHISHIPCIIVTDDYKFI